MTDLKVNAGFKIVGETSIIFNINKVANCFFITFYYMYVFCLIHTRLPVGQQIN